MINYNEMSDFEVNKLVAIELLVDGGEAGWIDSHSQLVPEYCNNPADMWPIIVENNIDVISPTSNGTEYWEAHKFFADVKIYPLSFLDKNPLRAAAIIFIIMQEAK